MSSTSKDTTTKSEPNNSSSILKAENPRGTIILLNGCKKKEKHTNLIQYLSERLVEKGWNTLLLSTTPSSQPTISNGLRLAKKQAGKSIVLLGHDCDTQAIINQAKNKNNSGFSAYITLGLFKDNSNISNELNAPLLDIVGSSSDLAEKTDKQWLELVNNSGGKRMELPMADDIFSKQEDNLIFLISNWLRN